MNTKRFISIKSAAARIMAFVLVATLALTAVTPVYALGNTVASIGVSSPQSNGLTYGSPASTTYTVTVNSTGPTGGINVALAIGGLPAGATASFNPASVHLSGTDSKTSVLTITTGSSTPAGSWPFLVRNAKNTKTGSGSLLVGPRMLDVQGTLVLPKVYDGNTNATLNTACSSDCPSLTGVLAGDTVTLSMVSGSGIFVSKNVGVEAVHVTGLAIGGTGASNYALPNPVVSSAAISAAPMTITANDAFKVSGGSEPDFTFKYGDFAAGEDETVPGVITTAPTCGVAGLHDTPNTYPIVCSGASAQNYDFTYVNGTLTVNATNEPPTDIALSNQTIPAGQAAGYTVGTLTTTDADQHLGETYSYSLVSGLDCAGNSSFQVDSSIKSNGPVPLLTSAPLALGSYNICIQTDDHNFGTYVKNFTITVVNTTSSFTSVGTYDGWILESAETSGLGGTKNKGSVALRVGDDALNRQYRSILSFDTSSLPAGAVISEVSIKVMKKSLVGNSKIFTSLKGLQVDIDQPSFAKLDLQLGDFKLKPAATAGMNLAGTFGVTPDSAGWYSVNLNPTAWQFINLDGTTQFRLRFAKDDNNNFIANYLLLFSGDALDPATRPQLLITYTAP